jgi:sugar phosphate permease
MKLATETKKYQYLVLALLYLGWCVSYIDRAAITFAATYIASEFHLKPSDLGILLSSFFLGYSLLQLPGGWLADRFGSRPVIVISILLWSVFTGVTGMAWSISSLVIIRFVFGLGEGAFPAASVKGVAETFSKEERPKMSSLLMSSNYVGSMLAPLIIAPMIIAYGWRNVFHYIGIAGLLFALVYWFVVKPVRAAKGSSAADAEKKAINKQAFRALLKMPLMWQIVAVWFGLSIVNKGLDSWMPTYLMTQRGLNLKSVGLLLPLPYVLAGISTAIGGWVMTRFFDGRERYLLIGSSILTAIFVYCMYLPVHCLLLQIVRAGNLYRLADQDAASQSDWIEHWHGQSGRAIGRLPVATGDRFPGQCLQQLRLCVWLPDCRRLFLGAGQPVHPHHEVVRLCATCLSCYMFNLRHA